MKNKNIKTVTFNVAKCKTDAPAKASLKKFNLGGIAAFK